MILVNESGIVIAQSNIIEPIDFDYMVDNVRFSGENLNLYDINVPEDMIVGRCTYINGEFTALPEIEPEPIINYTLEEAKEIKIKELSEACSSVIYNGTDIPIAEDNIQHFTLTEQDQLNLSGIGLELLMGAEKVAWHEDDETVPCQYYTPEQAQLIIGTLTVMKGYHITYFRDLRIYVHSLQTVGEVNAIEYGFALPEEFKSQVLKDYEMQIAQKETTDEESTQN